LAAKDERKRPMARDRFTRGLVWLIIIGIVVVLIAFYKMAMQSPMAGPILFVAFLALIGGAFFYKSKR
jgi:polyferredoxin